MTNIGLNVTEVDGRGSPSITGAAVSVAGFNVITRRGVPNQAQRVTSFPQFVERFGSYFTGGFGAYLVKGFFDNGGQTAYINRIPGPGAAAAGRMLQDPAPANTLNVEAGFRGQADPGIWGRQVFIRLQHTSSAETRIQETAPAAITGTALVAPIDMAAAAFPSITIRVDGQATAEVLTFAPANFVAPNAATLAEIRDAINGQTTRLIADITGAGNDQIRLRSTGQLTNGGFSSLQVTVANATLGFTVSAAPVMGTAAPLNTNGANLARTGEFVVGDAIVISDGTTTDFTKILTINEATGAVTWAPNLVNAALYADRTLVRVNKAEFTLSIATPTGDADHIVETHAGLTMEADLARYAPAVINHPLTGSRVVRVQDQLSASTPGRDRPAQTSGWVPLTGGSEGTPTSTHFIGDQATHTGFFAFDAFNVQIITCERTDTDIARAGIAYCQGRDDAMYVGAVPDGFVEGGAAVAYGQGLMARKAYGAVYGPWIIVPDPIGTGDAPRIQIPPVGHIMGVFARIEASRGIWKAPAGDEANLLGALDVTYRLSDADHTDLVRNGAVNGIRAVAGAGVIIDASRTLSSDPRWRYVNVRLLFNYVKSSLKESLRWVRQEPNRDFLWNAVKFGTVTPFLMGLWRQGAFGTGSAADTFTVIVDASNNPPDQVEQGFLRVEIYFYPSRPAETIVIIVGQQPPTASEA
jgi:hypothetical protein